MTKIVTTIDCVHGKVKIAIDSNNDKQVMELRWCVFDEGNATGFLTSFAQTPIMVTEVAAEQLLRMVISSLIQTFEVERGDLTIVNHVGELIPDVQFLPPTCEGNEADLICFLTRQDALLKLFSAYEEAGQLNSDFITAAEEEDILDDFLSLVQVRASGVFLAVRKPKS
jgi:hypothetical protein